MLLPVCRIVISQVNNSVLGKRDKTFTFDFCQDLMIEDSVDFVSGSGTLTLPRNVYFINENGVKQSWTNKNIVSGTQTTPLVIRGDKISISLGYIYRDAVNAEKYITDVQERFSGFISLVNNDSPITFEIEGFSYYLKQTQLGNKEYLKKDGYNLEKMLSEMLGIVNAKYGYNLKLRIDNTVTEIGDYRTVDNPTLMIVLDELKTEYGINSFFDGEELVIGIPRYYPKNRVNHVFHFQKNIIEKNLNYNRSDDIRIGIKVVSIIEELTGKVKANGKPRAKRKKIEGFAGDTDGDIRTLHFNNVSTVRELETIAKKMLPKLKFEGFKGTFETFGLPYVKKGDTVALLDDVITERKGRYTVKSVKPVLSPSKGLKQIIEIDLRLDTLTQLEQNSAI